jgi:hypothetical protein
MAERARNRGASSLAVAMTATPEMLESAGGCGPSCGSCSVGK